MQNRREELEEYNDIPDEDLEEWDEIPDEEPEWAEQEETPEKEIHMRGVDWGADIEKIEDPEMRREEVERAEDIFEKEKDLVDRWDSGEILEESYRLYEAGLVEEERKAIVRCVLKSKGHDRDDLEEIFESWDTGAPGSRTLAEREDQIGRTIDLIGEESVQDLANRLLREGRISRRTHETVSEHVRSSAK